jgi:hypothetical protein
MAKVYINIYRGKESICVSFGRGKENNKHKQTYITMTTLWRKKKKVKRKLFYEYLEFSF